MWVVLYIKVETYDNTLEWLVLEKSEERKPTKKFIKTINDVNSVIERYIETFTNSPFDAEMSEALPNSDNTIIYHFPKGDKHLQISIRAEVNKKKVELDKYYLGVA